MSKKAIKTSIQKIIDEPTSKFIIHIYTYIYNHYYQKHLIIINQIIFIIIQVTQPHHMFLNLQEKSFQKLNRKYQRLNH